MGEYSRRENDKRKEFIFSLSLRRDKHESFIDYIPERYKRKEYIIDKLKSKK